MKYHIFELHWKIWRHDWSSQLCTQLKQPWRELNFETGNQNHLARWKAFHYCKLEHLECSTFLCAIFAWLYIFSCFLWDQKLKHASFSQNTPIETGISSSIMGHLAHMQTSALPCTLECALQYNVYCSQKGLAWHQ